MMPATSACGRCISLGDGTAFRIFVLCPGPDFPNLESWIFDNLGATVCADAVPDDHQSLVGHQLRRCGVREPPSAQYARLCLIGSPRTGRCVPTDPAVRLGGRHGNRPPRGSLHAAGRDHVGGRDCRRPIRTFPRIDRNAPVEAYCAHAEAVTLRSLIFAVVRFPIVFGVQFTACCL